MASWPRCRYPAEMPVLTWRLAAAAAAASGLVLLLPVPAPWGLLAVDGALLLAALVDWLLAARPAELEVVRELPGIVPLGTQARVAWTVAYRRDAARRTGRPLRVRLADELAPSLRAATRRARVVLVPGGRASAATSIRPERRGRFTPGEMVVRVDGPLGLVARQGRRRLEGVLREYGVDDEFRRMDWAATARANKPIVRTYRAERNQTVLLLLDAGRTMAGLVAGVPRLEHAMDAVMMLTAVATRLGDRAGMVAFDSEVRAMVGAGHARDQLSRVTEAMYSLEPKLVESDYRGAFAATLSRFRRRTMLVVLTELAEQAVTQSLVPTLPLIARDHLMVVASVTDPQVSQWATSSPLEPGAAYRKAAATAALDDRRRTVARLRGLGAVVVDAPPGRLAPDLADAYLKVKATGRL